MAFSTFLQLIVHLFPGFDGSRRIPVLHFHETTVKGKLTGCLFHPRVCILLPEKLDTNCWCPSNNSFPHQENISLNEQHQSSATPQREKREEEQFIATLVSLRKIKNHILFIAGGHKFVLRSLDPVTQFQGDH